MTSEQTSAQVLSDTMAVRQAKKETTKYTANPEKPVRVKHKNLSKSSRVIQ